MDKQTTNRIGNAVRKVESLPLADQSRRMFDTGGGNAPKFGKVLSASTLSANRWTYVVQPVVFNGSTFVNDGATIPGVLNLNEWHNTNGPCGNGVNTTFLQGNYTIKPASTGTPIVILYIVGTTYVFSLVNGVDGTCI